MSDLKPCPFCGEAADFWHDMSRVGVECTAWKRWPVICNTVRLRTRAFKTKAEAIAAWNTRSTDNPPAGDVERVARAIYGAEADSDDLELGSPEWCNRLATAALAALRQSEWREARDTMAELIGRLRAFEEMLFHADAMAIKPTAPNQIETTQITTQESRLLQRALNDAIDALNEQPEG